MADARKKGVRGNWETVPVIVSQPDTPDNLQGILAWSGFALAFLLLFAIVLLANLYGFENAAFMGK